ncbi:type VII secretion protein EsaA [Lentibacillus jeotgali]|uniref:type VII secretion protein EsaA n=1 Tax=Lentibacillus jeotgali TaxID=558169 RepID=UPI000262747B|nr:type VII secretion protein EsaA [Lentibacillus jeotgali]
MNKSYIRLAVFLILMLALSLGLSYTSLNHVSEGKDDREDNTMSIALVNEDEGTSFNQNKLDFGDAFVESIGQNNDHEWYVVSRGVAESGLERNTYDMMIVIPNDFSKKALSIKSESPEQVVLDYKINASDSEAIQAQAEETASSIMNEFNRRIIDVYFASVLGNLQDAQDNVAEIVEEDAELTYTYNNAIQDPLSGYTNQFGAVQDNTEASRERFSSFEDTLNSYEERLTDRMGNAEDYQSNIADTAELTESHNVLEMDFLEQLNAYNDALNSDDVNEQLKQLQDANQYINTQFEINDNEMNNIAINTLEVQQRLDTVLETVEEAEKSFNIEEIKDEVKEELSNKIGDAFDGDDKLTALLNTQDQRMQDKIEEQISRLPSLNQTKIGNTDLSPETIQEIQNVIAVTDKYNNEFGQVAHRIDNDFILPDHIYTLKQDLHENGVEMTDTTELPPAKNSDGTFEIEDIPEGFTIDNLSIQMPGETVNYSEYKEGDKVDLPGYKSGEFTVKLKLSLKDLDQNINIYEPKEWKWKIKLTDKDVDEEPEKQALIKSPDAPLVASTIVEKTGKKENSQQNSNDSNPQAEDGSDSETNIPENGNENNKGKKRSNETSGSENGNDDSDDSSGEPSDNGSSGSEDNSDNSGSRGVNEDPEKGNESDQGKSNVEGDKTDEEENGGGSGDDEGEEPKVEKVKIENNHYIRHKVTDPVVDESTQDLIHAVENTIKPYQKLLTLYEAYFGIPLTCDDECPSVDNGNLKDLASDDSLYALFNKDVGTLLANHVASELTKDVTNEITQPLTSWKNQIKNHRSFIEKTGENVDELLTTIAETKEKAGVLNENLESTLKAIQDWREKSQNLIESQTEIQEKNGEVNQAVMTLGDEFQPLLSQSQTLADQASNNTNRAESVYQTFERIDKQAESIQESGTTVVQKAENLSSNMTDQLLESQEFADNFTEVMANSQIGERQNEELYDFLSNPVDTKNAGIIIEGNRFTPYFLVLICFIVGLFTAYVISTANQHRVSKNQFEGESSLMGRNSLITGITTGLGALEGLVIGLVSAYFLDIGEVRLILWTGIMILIMLTMVLVSTYLLRQLKMIGMFILLAVMSMYLFLTEALTSSLSGIEALRNYSPLQYVDILLTRMMQDGSDYQFIMFSMIGIALVAALANLLVVNLAGAKKTEDDDNAA